MEVCARSHGGNVQLLVLWGPGLLCKVSEYFYSFFSCCFRSGTCQLSSMGALLLTSCWDWCSCGFVVSRIWVSSRSLSWGGVIWVRYIVCVCGTRCMRRVGVISGIFSFCLCDDGKKMLSCLFYHNTPLQTCSTLRASRSCTCLCGDKDLMRMSVTFSCVEI